MIPSVNPKFDAWVEILDEGQRAQIEAAWAEIQAHEDIGGRNGDYARRTRLLQAAARLLSYGGAEPTH